MLLFGIKQNLKDRAFEISYNKQSIVANDKILNKQNKKYNWGIGLIIMTIILSILLLIVDTSISVKDVDNNKINNIMNPDGIIN